MRSRAVVTALSLVVLAGCSNDPEPGAPGSSSTPAQTASPTRSATDPGEAPTSEPTEPTEPAVVAATGTKLTIESVEGDAISFRLPGKDWKTFGSIRSGELQKGLKRWDVDGSAIPNFNNSLDQGVETAMEFTLEGFANLARGDNRVVNGVEGFVIEGGGRGEFVYMFGAVYGEIFVALTFTSPDRSARSLGYIESVLASTEWL